MKKRTNKQSKALFVKGKPKSAAIATGKMVKGHEGRQSYAQLKQDFPDLFPSLKPGQVHVTDVSRWG
jgi:hypothetical protein